MFAVNALEVPGVAVGVLQAERRVRALGGDVASIQYIPDPVLARHLINGRAEQVILRHVQIGHAAEQIGALELLHRGPVHHIGMELHVQLLAHLLDVTHGHLAVPAAVHMHGQHAQAQPVSQIEHVGAVHPAGEAQNAVIVQVAAALLHHPDGALQLLFALAGTVTALRAHLFVPPAEGTDARLIKGDRRVGRVHHTARANLVILRHIRTLPAKFRPVYHIIPGREVSIPARSGSLVGILAAKRPSRPTCLFT